VLSCTTLLQAILSGSVASPAAIQRLEEILTRLATVGGGRARQTGVVPAKLLDGAFCKHLCAAFQAACS